MARAGISLPLALLTALLLCPAVKAKTTFSSSEIEGAGSDIIFCDLDGDHLKDAVLVDGLTLSIYFQDAKTGFPRKPSQQILLEEHPAIVWSTRLAGNADSLLLMTGDGVTEFVFLNRTNPPVRRVIIKRRTIVPDTLDEPRVTRFQLSADTAGGPPLLLVPVAEGLEIWKLSDSWRPAQLLTNGVRTAMIPAVANPGYDETFSLNMSVNDANGDGRDDLMVNRRIPGGRQVFELHLQQTNGLFATEPAMSYTNKVDSNVSFTWADFNRDGRIDLVKGTAIDEPFFVPGLRSGKVIVGTYPADEHGRFSDAPQQVFRKSDWAAGVTLIDVDGDGFPDLILGYIPINTREGLRKMITAEQVDMTLRIHCGGLAAFSKDPDIQRDLTIHLDRNTLSFPENCFDGGQVFLGLDGDFNGDGKRDLVVRDRSNLLLVYFFLSREKGFSADPDLKFRSPEAFDWWETRDLNGDGICDLVVHFQKEKGFRFFLSQGR